MYVGRLCGITADGLKSACEAGEKGTAVLFCTTIEDGMRRDYWVPPEKASNLYKLLARGTIPEEAVRTLELPDRKSPEAEQAAKILSDKIEGERFRREGAEWAQEQSKPDVSHRHRRAFLVRGSDGRWFDALESREGAYQRRLRETDDYIKRYKMY